MRVTHVDGNVTRIAALLAQRGDQRFGLLEGLGKCQSSPTAVEDEVFLGIGRFRPALIDRRFQPLLTQSLEAVTIGVTALAGLPWTLIVLGRLFVI